MQITGYALCFFVFFKQKTAYEMRISDWSSDVCSSDLEDQAVEGSPRKGADGASQAEVDGADVGRGDRQPQLPRHHAQPALGQEIQSEAGYRRCPDDPGRGSLRACEGEVPDRRLSGRSGAHQQTEGADLLPLRFAGRRHK